MKIIKFIKRNLKWITIISVMIIIISLILLKCFLLQKENVTKELSTLEELELSEKTEPVTEEKSVIVETVFVDIKGEVAIPGVYEIDKTKKVIDVIALAGGFTEQADTSLVNLAKQVTNEMVIIIYSKEEVKKALEEDSIAKIVDKQCICPEVKNDACLNNNETSNTNTSSEDTTVSEGELINLNTATLEELQTLSGIGESKAKAIIEYRESVGGFKTIEELMQVTGIGESLYEKIKNNITV